MSEEDRLRRAFRAAQPAPPAPEGAWVAIQERIERRGLLRRRARWAAWLAPVILLVAGVPAFEVLSSAGHRSEVVVTSPTPAVVPWAALPFQPSPQLFVSPTPPAASAAPACRGPQIRATDAGRNGAGGTSFYYLTMTNVSATPCLLSGYPASLTGLRASGQTVDLHAMPSSLLGGFDGFAAVLGPGKAGAGLLGTDSACYGQQGVVIPGVFAGVRIGLPGGGLVTLTAMGSRSYAFECGALVGSLGVAPPPPPYETLPYGKLQINLSGPLTVRAGRVLHYTMTLSNPTAEPIALSPCPAYLVNLAGLRSAPRYELNCAAARPIGPGSQETFAMQVATPAGLIGAGWLSVVFIAAPAASSQITITGPQTPLVRVTLLGPGQSATISPIPLPPFPVPSPSPTPSAP